MNWRFCPHCETQLDEATGICPACRWDSLAEPPPEPPAPPVSLTERYRGAGHESAGTLATAMGEQRGATGAAPRVKLMLLAGVLVLLGLYGGMFAYVQIRDATPAAPVTMTAP